MGVRNKAQKGPCYALEAVFSPPRVNIPAPSLLRPESRINQGFLPPKCVHTRDRTLEPVEGKGQEYVLTL